PPSAIPTEGIGALTPEVLADARSMGYCVKLLALAKRVPQTTHGRGDAKKRAAKPSARPTKDALDVRVHPAFIPVFHQLGTVPDVQNAVSVDSDALGTTHYQGPGAGGLPT